MNKPAPPQAGFGRELRAYSLHKQMAIYLVGVPKPLRYVTVCQVTQDCLVGRWHSSTHLIPIARIAYCRFEADSEPARDRHHTLNSTVNARPGLTPPKPRGQEEADADARTSSVQGIIGTALENLHKSTAGDNGQ